MKVKSVERASEIINKAKGQQVAIIGDVMLDRYFWGNVSRVSPEAPVPVIDITDETYHLGGAANVAKNLNSLGVEPLLCGMVGNDNSGRKFINLAEKAGIECTGLYLDDSRPTTVKTRIIGNNQHIARVDREVRDHISEKGRDHIISTLKKRRDLAGIIIEDYNKGTICKKIIDDVIQFSNETSIPVFVDPKKEYFFEFKGVEVFKPNRKEASQALDMPVNTETEIIDAGNRLLSILQCKNVLLTLGEQGMYLFESNGDISNVPTRARKVSDVSGAGDTAIATLVAAYVGGATIKEAASIANYAAGVVCEMPGIVAINIEDLFKSIKLNGG